jgi:hypothetical protein
VAEAANRSASQSNGPEARALQACVQAIGALDRNAIERVLDQLRERFAAAPIAEAQLDYYEARADEARKLIEEYKKRATDAGAPPS